MKRFIYLGMLFSLLLCGCSKSNIEPYIPEEPITAYYLMLGGGALRLGAEFVDENNDFDIISANDKKNEIRYKQKLGMFDFVTINDVITQITIPSNMCLLSSKYYVGMTEGQLLGTNDNFLTVKEKGVTYYLDTVNNVALQVEYDEFTEKAKVIQATCMRLN